MKNNNFDNDSLLTERDAAKALGLSHYTLQQWRFHGRGPTYVKLGAKAIRYSRKSLNDFISSSAVDPIAR